MRVFNFIKKDLSSLPFFLGKAISFIPFNFRPVISNSYKRSSNDIELLEKGDFDIKGFVFERMKNITVFAYDNIEFYKEYYDSFGFNPKDMLDFEDINKIPVINKEVLQSVSLDKRSSVLGDRSLVNTGGSSGKVLELYIQSSSVGHEWAHMHNIWSKVGFKTSDLRIVFSGRSNVRNIMEYDSARHQLNVNIYVGWKTLADNILSKFYYYSPKYLHGYPSAIFDFVIWLDLNKHPLLKIFKKNIKGLMLGSEYPNPMVRSKVEKILDCNSISWYGHTERAALAYECGEKGVYSAFQSYGYIEALEVNENKKLVATSYYNYAHPLIRYDTGDNIEPLFSKGVLNKFIVSEGRDGDYIFDFHLNKIFLTGLIFGRHHKIFDFCSNIQIFQDEPGYALILYVSRSYMVINPEELFDSSNVDIKFSFKEIPSPYKTKSGKFPLLVKEL